MPAPRIAAHLGASNRCFWDDPCGRWPSAHILECWRDGSGNRLVCEVLERRWNAKLEEQLRIAKELDALKEAATALTPADELTLRELDRHFAELWNSDACAMTSRKRIARTLIDEIVVDIDAAQQLNMDTHWHGSCHTGFSMKEPMSGAVVHKTAIEDVELLERMAPRSPECRELRLVAAGSG